MANTILNIPVINVVNSESILTTDIISLLSIVLSNLISSTQTYDAAKPKAFLNWMVVDENFIAVPSTNHLGAVQVPLISGSMQKQTLVGPASMVVGRNGWLYVYVSNESNQNVFFDNMVINHTRRPVLEKKDYYPFGMEIPGLSSQAFKPGYIQNRFTYTGKENQSKEFSDGTGLEDYDFGARLYDPQLGFWHNIDPLADISRRWSPYAFAGDNPIRNIDPDGMTYMGYG